MSSLAALEAAPLLAAGGNARGRSTSNSPPRKVIVGTAMQSFWASYEDEDRGIFWSNDPKITIGDMVRSIDVLELEQEMARVREFYRKAKVRR